MIFRFIHKIWYLQIDNKILRKLNNLNEFAKQEEWEIGTQNVICITLWNLIIWVDHSNMSSKKVVVLNWDFKISVCLKGDSISTNARKVTILPFLTVAYVIFLRKMFKIRSSTVSSYVLTEPVLICLKL